jgi:prepilin-type N-terminal cleavage/methylation domain-containing protein
MKTRSRRQSTDDLLRTQRGITAVELAVVLVIVGMLAFAAYPLLSSVREVMLVKGAAEQAAGGIRMARQLAITRGTNHCVEFASGQYRIREADTIPSCSGTVVDGYDWQALSNSGTVTITTLSLVFDPVGNRVLPTGPSNTVLSVDTAPAACLSTISVTLYGGVRVAGC